MKVNLAELFFVRLFWYITIILTFIVVFGGYSILVKPKMAMLRPGGALDINVYKSILAKEQQYLTDVKTLDAEYQNLDKEKLKKLSYIIADKLDVSGLLYFFDSLNAKFGITPANFSYSSSKGVTKIKINFKGKDYYEFKNYLKALEESARIIDVANIKMSVRDGDYSIELATYYVGSDEGQ
jgi:hypothetical protein